MEKPSWKPSPHAQAPFLCSARGKPGGGQRCGVWSFNSRLFERYKNRLAEERCAQVGSQLPDSANKKIITRKKNPRHSYQCSQHVLRSRPGPQATETMGSGTGKGRVTPFLTCPRSTRAPDRIVSPTRTSQSKTRASAQSRESLALLGVHPLRPPPPGRGAPGSPGRAPRHPPPPGAGPAPSTGNSLPSPATRPGILVARGPRVPLSAASPGLRNARRTAPSPTAETGCARPRVAPCPVGSVPRAPGAGGSGASWSKARKGTRADPLPPPRERAGEGPPPPPRSSRPSLPRAPSGNYPLPPRV